MLKQTFLKYIFCTILLFNIANSQITSTVPLQTIDFGNGAYLKDLNNVLPYYQGTWEGINNNKKYLFTFIVAYQQLIDFPNGEYYYRDGILGKFKIIDLITYQVLYDDTNITNLSDYKIYSGNTKGHLTLYFMDNSANCYNFISFSLKKINGQPNQLQFYDFDYIDYNTINCTYQNQSDIPNFLPQNDFVLTKQ